MNLSGKIALRVCKKLGGKIIKKISSLDNKAQFLVVIILIFIWRSVFQWRSFIGLPFSAEAEWISDASSRSFLKNLTILDSGYPVPLLRGLLWPIVNISQSHSALSIHLVSLIIASICCASVIRLQKGFLAKSELIALAIILGIFPPPDLLLWHNLSYYTFIPLVVFTCNYFTSPQRIHFLKICGVFSLLILTTKPQLLLSEVFIILYFIVKSACDKEKRTAVLFGITILFVAIILILVGRRDGTSINFSLGLMQIAFLLTSPFIIPAGVFLPMISMGLSGFTFKGGGDTSWYLAQFLIAASSIGIGLTIYKMRTNSSNSKEFRKEIFFLAVPIFGSFYTFSNSGFAINFFWLDISTIPLYSRHWLPFLFLSLLFFITMFEKKKRIVLLSLYAIIIQLIVLQIAGYNYFYSPFFTK